MIRVVERGALFGNGVDGVGRPGAVRAVAVALDGLAGGVVFTA